MTRLNQKSYRLMATEGWPEQAVRINPIPAWKRCFDLVGASLGLFVLSPLLLLVAGYIKLTSRGPVLFKHQRYGYLGQPLYVWKFRSMLANVDPSAHQKHVMSMAQNNGELKKMNIDAQLIPFGKWLRCSGIDELPQLFNVLKGEMSLVGPRPDVVPSDKYQEWQRIRFAVLPGLTGLWQVGGKNQTTFNEMNQLDALYVERRSFLLDLKIIILTVPAILKLVAEDLPSKNKPPETYPTEIFEREHHDSTA